MGKRHQGEGQQDSLIPTIKAEEQRLGNLMDQARQEAARLVAEARAEADRQVAQCEAEIPHLVNRERAARAPALQAAAHEELSRLRTDIHGLKQRAAQRLPKAVAYIVRRVWPRDLP
jgi:vacuolar-type H+-ATPase subunit H